MYIINKYIIKKEDICNRNQIIFKTKAHARTLHFERSVKFMC